jgi:hypothetical protein
MLDVASNGRLRHDHLSQMQLVCTKAGGRERARVSFMGGARRAGGQKLSGRA